MQEAQNLLETARAMLAAAATSNNVGGTPLAVLPQGYALRELDHLLPQPTRKKGTVELHDADSFVRYVNDHATPDSRIYVNADFSNGHVSMVCVLNENETSAGQANWRDHRAVFTPRTTPEWQAWSGKDKVKMTQSELGEFIEYHMPEIHSPEGSRYPKPADLLTFALYLTETRKVRFRSGKNLQNGQVQLEYVEESDDNTKGKLDIYDTFAIVVPPFMNGTAYQLEAKLRYRISRDGDLSMWFELQRLEKSLEDATRDLLAQVQEKTQITVLFGKP